MTFTGLSHRDTPGYKALRQGRMTTAGSAYHLRTSVCARDDVVLDGAVARAVVRSLLDWQDASRFLLIALVVMPDHVHVLGVLLGARTLATTFGRWKGSSSLEINRLIGRSGSLWQPGFYDHRIRKEEDISAIGRYIEHNSVRAGLAPCAERYPFSSALPSLGSKMRGRGWLAGEE